MVVRANILSDDIDGNVLLEEKFHIHSIFKLVSGVMEFFADVAIRIGCWKSANVLHYNLLHNIIRVPLVFMDVTPIGRILSRFSKDVDVLDNTLPQELSDVIYCLGDVRVVVFYISFFKYRGLLASEILKNPFIGQYLKTVVDSCK